jgi:hypothetical protein
MNSRAAIAVVLVLGGCVIGSDKYPRPRDLEPGWSVLRSRVLGIRALPPEVAPGETATFEVLLPDPNDEIGAVLWLACPPEATTPFGCAVDLSVLGEDATPEELAEAGVIGIEPGFAPRFVAPADALDALEPADRAEGLQYTVNAIGLPPDVADQEDVDFATFESAYKRIVISEATTPNQNPTIATFTVEGVDVPPGTVVELDPDQPYELSISLTDDSIETYEYVNPDGVLEQRVEEPWARWYATTGADLESTTIFPTVEADFVTGVESGVDGTWWVVVRDRRGGLAWDHRDFHVR